MARWSGLAALAVIGLLVVAANAEVFFKEDFTGMRSISPLSRLGFQSFYVACWIVSPDVCSAKRDA
jgi:hypothetical protein